MAVERKVTAANLDAVNKALERQADFYKSMKEDKKAAALLDDMAANRQKVLNDLYLEQENSAKKTTKAYKDREKLIQNLEAEQKKHLESLKQENKLLADGVKHRQRQVDFAKALGNELKIGWKYLQDSDKIIRSTVLNLGMSGTKAAAMRKSFEQSAGFVTRLGGTLGDIQGIMEGYADETGRARVMIAEMVKDITTIGKGTGLGIEQATRLGAQFELMGFDAKSTMDYVQGVVDTTERMGVNTTKVLKNVNDNFKRLNTYTFQQGVKGFAQMASYAEKFRIDIGQALNAADVSRTLEGAIDLTAQLQVMGGEFAKTDPFEMLFLSRNDPAKFTEKIADMTKGVVSFRKMADGTFEKFISPADRDRLAAVAKSMGMEAGALTEIAERQADIQKMRQEMQGMGLSDEQKKLIEGAAIFDKKSGKFQVQLAGTMRDISTLTKAQADSFVKETVSLEERAKQAMTFDETFKATIETLKAALLPLLKGINVILKPLSKVADTFSKLAGTWGGAISAALMLIAAAGAWKAANMLFNKGIENFIKGGLNSKATGAVGAGAAGGGLFGGAGAAGAPSPYITKGGAIRKGAGKLAAGQGAKALGKGAGFGAAMAGAGAGVMLAAEGISKLADSMSKLTPDQAKNLASIVKSLSWFTVGAAAAAVGVMALGAAGTAGSVGLLALGAAFVGIGFGISLATKGIGKMSEGLATMFTAMKGVGPDIAMAAGGIAGIATALGAATLTVGSGIAMALTLGAIAKHAEKIVTAAPAVERITAALKGSREEFAGVKEAVESLSNIKIRGGGALGELVSLLKQPLKVEFANDGRVTLTNDITLNLDGQKFMQKAYDVNIAIQKHESLRHNKGR